MHIELPSPPPPDPHPSPLHNDNVTGTNQCLCLPKAELNTKNSTKRQLCCRLVEFLVFNSIYEKKCDSLNIEDRVEYYVICEWPLRNIAFESNSKMPYIMCSFSYKTS